MMPVRRPYTRKMLTGVKVDSRTGPRMTATTANVTKMITKRTAKSPLERISHFCSPLTGEYEMTLAPGILVFKTHANFAFHKDRPRRISRAVSFSGAQIDVMLLSKSFFDTRCIHWASVMSSLARRFFPLTAIVLIIFNIANMRQISRASTKQWQRQWMTRWSHVATCLSLCSSPAKAHVPAISAVVITRSPNPVEILNWGKNGLPANIVNLMGMTDSFNLHGNMVQ